MGWKMWLQLGQKIYLEEVASFLAMVSSIITHVEDEQDEFDFEADDANYIFEMEGADHDRNCYKVVILLHVEN